MSYKSLDEILNEKNESKEKDIEIKIEDEVQAEELEKNHKNVKKRKNGRSILAIIATVMAIITGINVILALFKNRSHNDNTEIDADNIMTEFSDLDDTNNNNEIIDTVKLEDLDVELDILEELNSNKKEYNNPTGNVNVNEIVQDNKTKEIWGSEKAQQNSVNIGKEVIDTKDDTLEVKSNGEVYEKNIGYEIKDKNGNTTSSGDYDNGKIPGYVKDETTGEHIKNEDINLYTDPYGNVWESKEKYENYLKSLGLENESKETIIVPVEKPVDNNSNLDDNSNISQDLEQGKQNPDGTYTIFGVTYDSKADYQAYIMGEEGYIIVGDRVIYNGEKEKSKAKEFIK